MNIYLVAGTPATQTGPFTIEQINAEVSAGSITSQNPAWIEGWPEWRSVAELPGFILQPPPAPTPRTTMVLGFRSTTQRDDLYIPFWRPAYGAVIRDVAIMWCLTLTCSFTVVSVARIRGSLEDPDRAASVGAMLVFSNAIIITVGFVITGINYKGTNRWRHLCYVTLFVWLSSLVNLLFGVTYDMWVMQLPVVLVLMGIGGGISYAFRK